MSITYTWTLQNLKHNVSDGGVFVANWVCTGYEKIGSGILAPIYTATSYGTCDFTYDVSDPDFTPYADLTETQVQDWVYESLRQYTTDEDDEFESFTETAAEAKSRNEAFWTAKVQKQIDAAAANSSGVPW